ncbi:hypothetical protein NHX12_025006 [Muraenolepis orangiensis]|uniref:Dickkopf N-terminal cysteine-rich domain-containing protein n=1 Tax=Muraenolepis orangiensis TaxID=630683 RepID=A0A9Q0EM22_9TELE|nr:hypothetical protein NHX12_025006 [Muraenolepis orangiensis]
MLQCCVSVAMACLVVSRALCSGGSPSGGSPSALILNSNAIKNLAGSQVRGVGHAASSSPDELGLLDGGYHNILIDLIQALSCSSDAVCGPQGFCSAPRAACLPCKRRRKRCARDAMCCPGNQCSNGVCLPMDADIVQQLMVEETEPSATASSTASSHGASSHGTNSHDTNNQGASSHVGHRQDEQNSTTHSTATQDHHALTSRGLEGQRCLRSTDCSEGLCCARHFWSKICKPVLREGQVCTKHRKKGPPGLEIFQRCDCRAELTCRTQRGEEYRLHRALRALHTCQHH